MAKTTKTKIKTGVVSLKYVYIKGEGRDQAMPGEEPHMMFVASAVMPKDGEAHKALKDAIYAEWANYCATHNVKGKPAKNKHGQYMDGMKEELENDPDGTIDEDTGKVKKIPTGNIIATFKTNTTWPDGKAQVVKVKDKKGADITTAMTNAEFAIGEGSVGIIHGLASGNDVGGSHKVTLYLSAIQLAKLVKYEGDEIDCDEIEGDEIDLGDEVSGIDDIAENSPRI